MKKSKIITFIIIFGFLLVLVKMCKSSDTKTVTSVEKTVNNDSINKSVLDLIKKENKVKDAVLTDVNVLYVAVDNDGTNRNGLASYFCNILIENKSNIDKVKIVEFGSSNSPNKDNAYGVLLGESQCK